MKIVMEKEKVLSLLPIIKIFAGMTRPENINLCFFVSLNDSTCNLSFNCINVLGTLSWKVSVEDGEKDQKFVFSDRLELITILETAIRADADTITFSLDNEKKRLLVGAGLYSASLCFNEDPVSSDWAWQEFQDSEIEQLNSCLLSDFNNVLFKVITQKSYGSTAGSPRFACIFDEQHLYSTNGHVMGWCENKIFKHPEKGFLCSFDLTGGIELKELRTIYRITKGLEKKDIKQDSGGKPYNVGFLSNKSGQSFVIHGEDVLVKAAISSGDPSFFTKATVRFEEDLDREKKIRIEVKKKDLISSLDIVSEGSEDVGVGFSFSESKTQDAILLNLTSAQHEIGLEDLVINQSIVVDNYDVFGKHAEIFEQDLYFNKDYVRDHATVCPDDKLTLSFSPLMLKLEGGDYKSFICGIRK